LRLIKNQPHFFQEVMNKVNLPKNAIIILLLTLSLQSGHCQVTDSNPVRIMFYNVENFFDTYDDSIADDNDFLANGLMRWNLTRYNRKILSLYKTIIATGDWDPPAIIAFCEIESRKVLEDLIYGTNLSKYGYSIIHEDSPDRRGIDVCLIYRKDLIKVVGYKYWCPAESDGQKYNSRSILYTKFVILSDTLHIIANHWPSRRGGVLAGDGLRRQVASLVKQKVDSLLMSTSSGSKIIIIGDFNCTPDDQILSSLIASDDPSKSLVNLSDILDNDGSGTYRYMGIWEMIDQVIVSKSLLCGEKGLSTEPNMLRIFRPEFLMKKDPKYPGLSPLSTYRGFKYQGGFSDHLPVYLDLIVK
jgi:hypothetical protein